MRTVNTWCPSGSLCGLSLTHAGASLGTAGHGSAIFKSRAHSGTICRCHNGSQSPHREEGVAEGRGRLGEEKLHIIWCWVQLLLPKKKKLEVTANTCYFQFQELISESKGVATRWVYAGDGLYFCILVVVLSFL